MHARLRARAARAGVELDLHATVGRTARPARRVGGRGDLQPRALQCPDPAGVVAEVHRVLRPGGRYPFVEHVAAPEHTALRRLQRAVRRPWGWFFEGCSCERDLRAVIERSPFAATTIRTTGSAAPSCRRTPDRGDRDERPL